MTATQNDIRNWLREGQDRERTHMIVVCDTFSYEDYPVYVGKGQDVRKVAARYDGKNMQRVMEVYSYRKSLEAQLDQDRVFNFD